MKLPHLLKMPIENGCILYKLINFAMIFDNNKKGKGMKKIISAVLLLMLFAGTSFAQRLEINRLASYERYYGFRVGYNSASLRFTNDDVSGDATSGLNFGFIMGYPLGETAVVFEPGILYTVKGGKTHDNIRKSEVHMHGLEVPFVMKYSIEVPASTDVFVQPFFGGFFGLGLGGKIKHEDPSDPVVENRRQKVGTFSNRFKRFDAGLRMGCGVNIDFFYFELAYDLGLANLGQDSKSFQNLYPKFDSWDDKARTGCLSVGFGVNF